MGGMIAQTLAATQPELVRSLVSIMSNTGGRCNGQPSLRIYPTFLRRAPAGRDAYIAHAERLFAHDRLAQTPARSDSASARIAEHSFDRDPDTDGAERQLAAIQASPDRTRALRTIAKPTLVIHGSADPLVCPQAGAPPRERSPAPS